MLKTFFKITRSVWSNANSTSLEKQGIQANSKRVSRLISEYGLVAKGTRKAYRKPRKEKAYKEKEKCLEWSFLDR